MDEELDVMIDDSLMIPLPPVLWWDPCTCIDAFMDLPMYPFDPVIDLVF